SGAHPGRAVHAGRHRAGAARCARSPEPFVAPSSRGRQIMNDAPPIFRATGLSKNFGGVRAVKDVSLAVEPATVFAIIGPNGAGKSTLLNLISGVHAPDAGTMAFGDLDFTGLPPHARVRHGLARTFQKIRLFRQLS